jgi:hypothetical protein
MLWDVHLKVWDREDCEAWYTLVSRYLKAGFNHMLLGGPYYTLQDYDKWAAMRLSPINMGLWSDLNGRCVKLTIANAILFRHEDDLEEIRGMISESLQSSISIDEYEEMLSELHLYISRAPAFQSLLFGQDLEKKFCPDDEPQLEEIRVVINETLRRPLYEVILTLEAKDEEEGYEIGYAHLKKQGYDIVDVSSYEKYSFDVDVLKAAM